MKSTTKVVQVLLSIALWRLVEAKLDNTIKSTPAASTTTTSTLKTGNVILGSTKVNLKEQLSAFAPISSNDLSQVMGRVEPQNCVQTQNSWTLGQPLWGKLSLAEHYTLYQNVYDHEHLQGDSSNALTCRSFAVGSLSWQVKFKMNPVPGSKDNVKSYSNACWAGTPKLIRTLITFYTAWSWKMPQASSDLIADVAYDIFTAKDGNCTEQTCASTEIMVWLVAIGGALPASSTGKSVGTLQIRGSKYTYKFDVWKGVVGNKAVISLIPSNNARYTFFTANFKDLFKQLEAYGLSQNEYVVNVGAGPEVFQGSGTLDTSKYLLNIK